MFGGERRGGPTSEDRQRMRARAAETVFNLMRRSNGMEIFEESILHLRQANKALEKGSLVVYINHVRHTDAFLIIPLVMSLPAARKIMGPVGMKHYDFRRDPVSATAFRALRLAGIYPSPVVQAYDRASYEADKQRRMSENLQAATRALLRKPGTIYGIAPEGTRTKTGILKKAYRGIGYLENYMDKGATLTYLPIGLVYANMGDTPEIRVDTPFTLSNLVPPQTTFSDDPKERAQQIADVFMKFKCNKRLLIS